jgi:hypothetical protein
MAKLLETMDQDPEISFLIVPFPQLLTLPFWKRRLSGYLAFYPVDFLLLIQKRQWWGQPREVTIEAIGCLLRWERGLSYLYIFQG